jgi:hypothetical protein
MNPMAAIPISSYLSVIPAKAGIQGNKILRA